MKKLYGWTGNILTVDLSVEQVSTIDTRAYADRFIGGKGIAQKIYWDLLSPGCSAFDPRNPLIIMTGPLAATPAPGGSRWVICAKSPSIYPELFMSANLGGSFGAVLKKAGFDGIVITGRAGKKVCLRITGASVDIIDASALWGMTTGQTMDVLRRQSPPGTRILTTGPAGEHLVRMATVAGDAGSSGSMGFGAVMGSKNLKAVTVHGTGRIPVARPEQLADIKTQIARMTGEGYLNLYGMATPMNGTSIVKKIHCYGCPQGCWRSLYRGDSGIEGVRKCQAMFFYSLWDRQRHGDTTEATHLATALLNEYSLCTMELPGLLYWLQQCMQHNIIEARTAGFSLDDIGSIDFLEKVVRSITFREGFGDVLAEGTMRAAARLGPAAQAIAADHFTATGRGLAYGPKIFSPSALIYATEPKAGTPQLHEICGPATKWAFWYTTGGAYSYFSTAVYRKIAERFWNGADAADFSTLSGKARAAAIIQNRQYAKESLILCDFAYPVFDDASTADHVGDPTLEHRLLAAVTGDDADEQALLRAGERSFNLNRALLLREGRAGRPDDRLPETQFIARDEPVYDVFGMFNPELFLPGSGDAVISMRGNALSREGFALMLDEYYMIRGWDTQTGFPLRETLRRLDLQDIVPALQGTAEIK
jgi:aldehyde:ferredoxin oxidoreductase